MGMVGLVAFIGVMVGFFTMIWSCWREGLEPQLEAILLGLTAGIVGALVSGVFDHYWFNMTYPHMTVLFWLFVGLATATVLIQREHQQGS